MPTARLTRLFSFCSLLALKTHCSGRDGSECLRVLILRDDPWLLTGLPDVLAGELATIETDFAPEVPPVAVSFRNKGKLAAIALRQLGRLIFSGFHRRVQAADAVLACGITVVLPYLLLARMGKRFRPKGPIVIAFFFLHRLGQKRWVQRALRVLLDDRRVRLAVYSEADREYFSTTVGLRRASIAVVPYGQPEPVLAPLPADRPPRYVFAGGYSNRDYQTVGRALVATGLPTVVVCSALNPLPEFPDTVRVLRDIDPREFNAWVARADLVVIPLGDRVGSSGQAVALTAMSLGRAIVYSDTPCLREYFVPGTTGAPYAQGNDVDLAARLRALWDDFPRRERMGSAARADFEARFTQRRMFAGLAKLIGDGNSCREQADCKGAR